jgi:hypothetical protein
MESFVCYIVTVIAHIKACFERIIPLLKMKFVIASFVMLFALASVWMVMIRPQAVLPVQVKT